LLYLFPDNYHYCHCYLQSCMQSSSLLHA
jgi:hypothetical protein